MVYVETLLTADAREQLLTRWFAEYQAPLARYLLRVLSDEEQAGDVLQDTWEHSFAALKRHPPPDNAGAWLHRIATNLAFNALRRRRRFRWLPLLGNEPTSSFEGDVATAQSVQRCLAQINPKDAEALLLYEYVGLSSAEIAAQTGDVATAVRMRLSRARRRFRALYEKEIGE